MVIRVSDPKSDGSKPLLDRRVVSLDKKNNEWVSATKCWVSIPPWGSSNSYGKMNRVTELDLSSAGNLF